MKNITTPRIGINPPFKNITEIVEKRSIRKRKNNPDNTIEILLLKIINYTLQLFLVFIILKTLGMPNNFFNKLYKH